MAMRSHLPRLLDMIEAIDRVHLIVASVSLDVFEEDWEKRWVVERGIEILSEASRHLPQDLKARWPEIPWRKVAGIGNVLRHSYERIEADVLWKLATVDLIPLLHACREEMERIRSDKE
jgi:uncharacterized protein with HEPN domain